MLIRSFVFGSAVRRSAANLADWSRLIEDEGCVADSGGCHVAVVG